MPFNIHGQHTYCLIKLWPQQISQSLSLSVCLDDQTHTTHIIMIENMDAFQIDRNSKRGKTKLFEMNRPSLCPLSISSSLIVCMM